MAIGIAFKIFIIIEYGYTFYLFIFFIKAKLNLQADFSKHTFQMRVFVFFAFFR